MTKSNQDVISKFSNYYYDLSIVCPGIYSAITRILLLTPEELF